MRWADHVTCSDLIAKPETKRPLVEPRHTAKDNDILVLEGILL
jgi:hypothetical protein